MKLLLLSDSHGDFYACQEALRQNRDADWVIHLGDGEEDLDRVNMIFLDKKIARVRGNCSYYSPYREEQLLTVEGKKLFLCHGHRLAVKTTLSVLSAKAASLGCDAALFGHTHRQEQATAGGVLLCNPGALKNGSYATLSITPEGILFTPQYL